MQFDIGTDGFTPADGARFRRAWVHPPSGEAVLASLRRMDPVVIARDRGRPVGFVCGLTDRVSVAYVWDLEVLHDHRGCGIERGLLERFVAACGAIYQINAHPALEQAAAFEAAGFRSYPAREAIPMTIRDLSLQGG